ncbi:MAG: MlaD family protein, partial [Solirubrobacterales bacterium]
MLGASALLLFGLGAEEDEGGSYQVRAIFDSGGFLVADEEVRIAGARVGVIAEVDVTGTDEVAREDGSAEPGSAVVVLEIDEPAFQDFRADASCVVRPQSLLGERFVECKPTQPRAAGSEIPPELEVIPDGEPGEGQRLLPLERNRKAVDLDLLNNIMEEPYPDRFRLILNELGAGLATRGADLEEVIDRANPALQETNEVLVILAEQSRQLEQLAANGDRALAPLARERERVSGFLRNATVTAEATAERREDLEAGLEKLPGFLREVQLTMPELERFSDEATPTLAALGDAAPFITRATVALGPFADAANRSVKSLGDATEEAGPDIRASDPILTDIRDLAEPLAAGMGGGDSAGVLQAGHRDDAVSVLLGEQGQADD